MNFYNHDVDAIAAKLEDKATRGVREKEKINEHKDKWPLLSMYATKAANDVGKKAIEPLKSGIFKERDKRVNLGQKEAVPADKPALTPIFLGKGSQKQVVKAPLASVFSRIANAGIEETKDDQRPSVNTRAGSVFKHFKL